MLWSLQEAGAPRAGDFPRAGAEAAAWAEPFLAPSLMGIVKAGEGSSASL